MIIIIKTTTIIITVIKYQIQDVKDVTKSKMLIQMLNVKTSRNIFNLQNQLTQITTF